MFLFPFNTGLSTEEEKKAFTLCMIVDNIRSSMEKKIPFLTQAPNLITFCTLKSIKFQTLAKPFLFSLIVDAVFFFF